LKHELAAGRGGQEIDLVLTARELVLMIKEMGLAPGRLAPEAPDAIAGDWENTADAACEKSLSEAVADAAGGRGVRAVTVYGLANAEEIIGQIKAGDVRYDFIEVLACPRGCATGAGHPLASVRQRMQSET